MEVINLNTFLLILEQMYKNTCESFGEKFNPEKYEILKNKKIIIYNEKIKPLIDKKFQFVGSENSLFDPLRKIEMVWFDNGNFYEVFKYKKGRKKYTQIINI